MNRLTGFLISLFLMTFGVNAYANNGACYIRVQYGPIIADSDQIEDMTQTYCFPNYTREACHLKADRKNFTTGLVLSTTVIGWERGKPCVEF